MTTPSTQLLADPAARAVVLADYRAMRNSRCPWHAMIAVRDRAANDLAQLLHYQPAAAELVLALARRHVAADGYQESIGIRSMTYTRRGYYWFTGQFDTGRPVFCIRCQPS